jgi:hypothetical protein
MESNSKTVIAALILAAATLQGCAWFGRPVPVVITPPKPTIDARILALCKIELTPLPERNIDPSALFTSYGEAIVLLNACECRQRAARNELCALTNPGCTPVKPCEGADANSNSLQ